ncbi:MAG: hypothetical protein EOO61_08110 [Hymenobacter sp.]|nr:MAG: hypothetical protein EOO61_08110 [Hymenobacter sp.]
MVYSNCSATLPSESLINLVDIDKGDKVNESTTAVIQPLLPPSKRGISEKKRKGIFYTPNKAVNLLVTWAIRSQQDVIFEPSFGGCGFLESSIVRLQDLGCTAPHERLLGCDIDPTAFAHLHKLLGTTPDNAHFKLQDFLRATPADFGQTADVVIGNPPYVSWHNMLPAQREAAASVRTATGGHLNNKGSLWTFFLAHSLRFLRPGGRMAWILPGSFLYADYAVEIRTLIEKSFQHSIAIVLAQRLFIEAGTEESTVILLAEGFQSSSDAMNPLRFAAANGLAQALPVIQEWEVDKNAGLAWSRHINRLFLPAAVTTIYDRLQGSAACRELGELAKVKIGLVTGDNSFFVLTRAKAREYQLAPNLLRPIVARQVHLKGLQVTPQDLLALEQEDAKCLLLSTTNSRYKSTALKRFLATYPSEDIATNRTFAKRSPWYFIAQEAAPDAFLSCMNWYGPQLVINAAATTCTNTGAFRSAANRLAATRLGNGMPSSFSASRQFTTTRIGCGSSSSI